MLFRDLDDSLESFDVYAVWVREGLLGGGRHRGRGPFEKGCLAGGVNEGQVGIARHHRRLLEVVPDLRGGPQVVPFQGEVHPGSCGPVGVGVGPPEDCGSVLSDVYHHLKSVFPLAVRRGGHGHRPIGGYLPIEYGHGSPEAEHPSGLPEDVFRTIEHLAEGAGDMLRRHTRAVVNYSEAVWFWIR